jgi:hypothetical protein
MEYEKYPHYFFVVVVALPFLSSAVVLVLNVVGVGGVTLVFSASPVVVLLLSLFVGLLPVPEVGLLLSSVFELPAFVAGPAAGPV